MRSMHRHQSRSLNMVGSLLSGLLVGAVCVLCIGCHRSSRSAQRPLVDSLNARADAFRYQYLDSVQHYATLAWDAGKDYLPGRMKAANTLGFTAYMRMDYEEALHWYDMVLRHSESEIECLRADVGMMQVYQRTAGNRSFYECRLRASKRLQHISEEAHLLSDAEQLQLKAVIADMYMASAYYHYKLEQRDKAADDFNRIDEYEILLRDSVQWGMYTYMKGIGVGMLESNNAKRLLRRFDDLKNTLLFARAHHLRYLQGLASTSLAQLCVDTTRVRYVLMHNPHAMGELFDTVHLPTSPTRMLTHEAERAYTEYGDNYGCIANTLLQALLYNIDGDYTSALKSLNSALTQIDLHYHTYYELSDSATLTLYSESTDPSMELIWLSSGVGRTVPNALSMLREQASVAFSGLGNKKASDYNRNIYLDILDITRQDKELESRYLTLEKTGKKMNVLFGTVIVGIILFLVVFVFLSQYWKRRNKRYIIQLRNLLSLCKEALTYVPQGDNPEELATSLTGKVRDSLCTLLHLQQIRIAAYDDDTAFTFPLVVPGKKDRVGTLCVEGMRRLTADQRTMLHVISPYLAISLENGLTFSTLGDRQRQLEKSYYLHQMHIAENKRDNIVRKATFSMVVGMMPYIDRMVNEIEKLQHDETLTDKAQYIRRLQYISELSCEINELNDILSHWIKTSQGLVKLHIESFALSEVFDIIAKSRLTFTSHGLHLDVKSTDAFVKADKTLTFFMINTLADNARKFTPEGGTVTIEAVPADDYIEISVTDTGVGLTQSDIDRILHEKVYDAHHIGASLTAQQRQKKGSGFGLLNCKGIIDKYRKTDELFSVCRFGIESKPGQGSRFYFRLPKGVRRLLTLVLLFLLPMAGSAYPHQDETPDDATYDSLLVEAAVYADSVYYANVDGCYHEALRYADSTLAYINRHYLHYASEPGKLLQRFGNDPSTEIRWWLSDFATDYHTILDVRNELAVANLALCRWDEYRYNNLIYTNLYKLISEDRSLVSYCNDIQRYNSNTFTAILFCIILLVLFIVGYYMLYYRHRMQYRLSLEQVFDVNRQLLNTSYTDKEEPTDVSQLADMLYAQIHAQVNDLFALDEMAIAICDNEDERLHFSHASTISTSMREQMRRCFTSQTEQEDAPTHQLCLPLNVVTGDQQQCVGVWACRLTAPIEENDRLMARLIAEYMGVIVYNDIVRLAQAYRDVESVEDDTRRAQHEENRLHVQNMVLDNCLSTIKHETVYYPNRIKQIADNLLADQQTTDTQHLHEMKELVAYYKMVFTILTDCAMRQLEEITFRRTDVMVSQLFADVLTYQRRQQRRYPGMPPISTTHSDLTVMGDAHMLAFLLENLLEASWHECAADKLQLTATADGDFVRITLINSSRTLSDEFLHELFYPSAKRMQSGGDGRLRGTEYMICRQIIREHDEFFAHIGCRIQAQALPQGYAVWFTVPRKV